MKIALISEHASPLATLGGEDAGGQNVHVAALALALARRGASVVVYTRRDARDLPVRVPFASGVVVEHVEAGPARVLPKDDLLPHMEAFAAILRRSWSEQPPDIVHGHFWMSGRAALAAAKPIGIPVVQTFHALGVVKKRHQGAQDRSPVERLDEERSIVARADRIIATCRDEVAELRQLGACDARTTIVPCGVDLGFFRPDGPAEPRRRGRRRLVAVGRLVERKGFGDVVAALERLPGVELVIAGGPPREDLRRDPEARRLTEIARRHGVGDRVELRGGLPRAAIAPLLRSADAVVCVPWYEPFGIVPLEAMACGVPVVGAAVGGLLDTVIDGETGVHVPPRDPAALARAVARLLADDVRRAHLGRGGASRARGYGWDRIGEQTLAAYRATLARRRVAVLGPMRRKQTHSVARAAIPATRKAADRGR